MRRAELESVLADTGAKVGTKAGKVNVPDDVPEAANETLAVPEPAVDPEALDGARSAAVPGAEEFNGEGAFPWIEEMMVGREFPSAQTTASAMESTAEGAKGAEAADETTIGAGDN